MRRYQRRGEQPPALRMLDARAIILCPTPLGPGNIALIEAALAVCQAGGKVVVLEPTATAEDDADAVLSGASARDFSDPGTELYRQLLTAGCSIASTASAALRLLG